MTPFEWFAIGFAGVAILNLALVPKRGIRAALLAAVAGLCAVASYLWERSENAAPMWVLAAAGGVFLASLLHQATAGKSKRE